MNTVFTMILVLASYPIQAQQAVRQNSLLIFDKRMSHLKKIQARVLGSWATLNIVAGGVFAFTTQGEPAFFQAMNLSWGVVNGGMAAFLYFHHQKELEQPKTLLYRMEIQRHVEKVMLLNIGLDIAFIFGGVSLHQHGQIKGLTYSDLWRGFGTSVIMQGAFLLLQDYIFYRLHIINRKKVYPDWKGLMSENASVSVDR